jgi:hypothetical protein
MKHLKPILLFFISIFASLAIQALRKDLSLGAIVGGGFALIFAPYVIASLIQYGTNTSKWDYNSKSFAQKFILLWTIYFLLNLLA